MNDFFNNINGLLTKEFLSKAKIILENPNNFSDKIINFLNKNNIDLNNIGDIPEKEKSIICNPIEEKDFNDLSNENDYEILFLRLSNIENTMIEIQKYLHEDN